MAKAHCTDDGRVCTVCGEFKGWDDFGDLKLGERGKASNCLMCAKWYGRIRRAKPGQERDDLKGQLAALKASAAEVIKSINMASPTATCSWCKIELPRSMFGPDRTRLNGLKPYCKKCKALESRRYRTRNPEVAAMSSREWAQRNPEKRREKYRRWAREPKNKIHLSVVARVYECLKSGKGGRPTEDLIGYRFDVLKDHLEKQFLPGMSWENYGAWHIDHIVPLSSFEISSRDDPKLRLAWCLSNLRPIWAKDNLIKNARRTFLI